MQHGFVHKPYICGEQRKAGKWLNSLHGWVCKGHGVELEPFPWESAISAAQPSVFYIQFESLSMVSLLQADAGGSSNVEFTRLNMRRQLSGYLFVFTKCSLYACPISIPSTP